MPTAEELELCDLKFTCKDCEQTVQVCQLAAEHGGIAVVGVVGPNTSVKAFCAAMQTPRLNVDIHTGAVPLPEYQRRFWKQSGSYRRWTANLGYNQAHAVLMLDDARLLTSIAEEDVWSALNSERYTTPLLREWVPWLMQELQAQRWLVKLNAFGCAPGLLTVEQEQLDALVSRGLSEEHIRIEEAE